MSADLCILRLRNKKCEQKKLFSSYAKSRGSISKAVAYLLRIKMFVLTNFSSFKQKTLKGRNGFKLSIRIRVLLVKYCFRVNSFKILG